ncbi:hypothetical protein K437DRAFT_270691 [Tilletiaria anomala UBC 951]|uniref:Uncharacterized protein n=1 Tax=Tilletiaria anomala (strain ATCC 24038 / CBS 436.72 / UBC 951) TaxID=1037660 RepID=A0A066VCG1_TILAU|nr:uncharacterized protein K437DRAFT_270691 [Tilletiaria anomala UBC 951]KDN37978.1 hypothetical protein K437DRAFT_270691 [Tilletiaria anomala UBC 951]
MCASEQGERVVFGGLVPCVMRPPELDNLWKNCGFPRWKIDAYTRQDAHDSAKSLYLEGVANAHNLYKREAHFSGGDWALVLANARKGWLEYIRDVDYEVPSLRTVKAMLGL